MVTCLPFPQAQVWYCIVDDNTRSFITCKADAFSPPYALIDHAFLKGSSRLSPREQCLADIYAFDLNRADLAAYVWNGKKFQRLYQFLRFEETRGWGMRAMRRAFLGEQEKDEGRYEGKNAGKKRWVEWAKGKYGDDGGLKKLVKRVEERL